MSAWRRVLACLLPLSFAATALATEPRASSLLLRSESRLLEAVGLLQSGNLDGALEAAQALTREVPDFHAAQLLEAQLLQFKAGQRDAPPLQTASEAQRLVLDNLQKEIQRRVRAHHQAPAPGAVPRNFVHIDRSVRHVVAIDASQSRLYLLANGEQGLRLVADFYISVGREGVGKNVEGDQRTPLGMYFVTRSIPGSKLPDLYGVGALPINYPNDWDRAAGRTGSGIWLHGSPSQEFARVPEASEGCVVLSNPDMELLLEMLDRRTPVLIADAIDWVQAGGGAAPAGSPSPSHGDFKRMLVDWREAWRTAGQAPERLEALYAAELLQSAPLRQRRAMQARHLQADDFALAEVSVYDWSDGHGEVRIVNLRSTSKVYADGLLLRQYWRKQADGWQLFSEDVLG